MSPDPMTDDEIKDAAKALIAWFGSQKLMRDWEREAERHDELVDESDDPDASMHLEAARVYRKCVADLRDVYRRAVQGG